MATEPSEPDLDSMMQDAAALDAAIARVHADREAASHAAAFQAFDDVKIYEVPGIGRYAIPLVPGWKKLLELIKDPSVDINFSLTNYPSFDKILSDHARSDHLDFPDDPEYDTRLWRHVRDNIAAVRNYLLQVYYADTPEGLSQEKARQNLEEIAVWVGDAMTNNYRFGGVVKNHDPSKPFLDLDRLGEGGGAGAQYLYQEILKRQRRSGWNFLSMIRLKSSVDWSLPPAHEAPFLSAFLLPDAMNDNDARLQNLEGERNALERQFQTRATELAEDMEFIGERLLHTAEESLNAVSSMKPERLDEAVRLAKDILDKLKIKLGDRAALDGLGMRPEDDAAALGSLASVGDMYGRLLAWARGIDPSIAQHPSIMAATSALGQLGYMAKGEAQRLALAIGNTTLADRIGTRLATMGAYRPQAGTKFGDLLERVRGGIDTVLQMKTITGPGASVGHSRDKDLGGAYMNAAPIAGLAMQTSTDGTNRNAAGKISEEILRTQDAAAQAQANRINSQINARNAQTQGQGQPVQQQQQAPSRGVRGTQALQQARRQRVATSVSPNALAQANLTVAQRAALLQRNAAIRAAHAHDDQNDHHQPPAQMQRMQQLVNADMLRAMKSATNTQGLAGAPITTNAASYKAIAAAGRVTTNMYGKATAVKPPANDDEKRRRQQEPLLQPPPPPNKGGMVR